LQQRLAAIGQYVTYSPGPNTNPDLEQELRRWLAVGSTADGASGFRAGWIRLARFLGPKLHELGEPLEACHTRSGQAQVAYRRAASGTRPRSSLQVSGEHARRSATAPTCGLGAAEGHAAGGSRTAGGRARGAVSASLRRARAPRKALRFADWWLTWLEQNEFAIVMLSSSLTTPSGEADRVESARVARYSRAAHPPSPE
jgi:hypothetical protein